MNDHNTTHLILEHLKRFQAGQEKMLFEIKDLKGRVSQIEIGIAGIRGDISHVAANQARQQVSMDRLAERIDRIESRLEL